MRIALASLLLAITAACGPSPTPVGPVPDPGTGSGSAGSAAGDPVAVTPGPATDAGAAPATCSGPAPGPTYVCVQDCGPPVVRQGDPPPGWSWLSPDDARRRAEYGCPRCLPPDTQIATPGGPVPLHRMTVGAPVLTIDASGRAVAGTVLHVGSSPVPAGHPLVRLTLADGRMIAGSPGHPDAQGRALADLTVGAVLDGAVVVSVEREPFPADRTWDLLPSGPTGLYVANGVILRSTFFRAP